MPKKAKRIKVYTTSGTGVPETVTIIDMLTIGRYIPVEEVDLRRWWVQPGVPT